MNDCLLCVDTTDCPILHRGPVFASHKFAGKSALRYEVASSILGGDICWINGGFPAGSHADVEIFRSCLVTYLEPFERVEADDGYIAEAPERVRCPKCVTVPQERKAMMSVVRSRHETINRRLKQWRILKTMFRHDITMHETAFTAVAVMTQIAISNGEPLFDVEYSDNFDVSDDENYADDDWESSDEASEASEEAGEESQEDSSESEEEASEESEEDSSEESVEEYSESD